MRAETQSCFERLLELVGRKHAPGVDIRKSFAKPLESGGVHAAQQARPR